MVEEIVKRIDGQRNKKELFNIRPNIGLLGLKKYSGIWNEGFTVKGKEGV